MIFKYNFELVDVLKIDDSVDLLKNILIFIVIYDIIEI